MTIVERTDMMSVAGEQLQVRLLHPQVLEDSDKAPMLIFLHEALGCIEQWRDFPEALVGATGLPALIYDRCGFGGSQPLAVPRGLDYMQREVASLDALLTAYAVATPLLVGHSDGATLALLYAAAFPERPQAVISEAAHLFVEDETLVGIRDAVERWRTTDLPAKIERFHGVKASQVFSAWTETWLNPDFREWNIEAEMKHIRCPVLAMQGVDDDFGTERQLQAIRSGVSGPCRTRLLPACGHTPHREARDEVLAEMTDFIAELGRFNTVA